MGRLHQFGAGRWKFTVESPIDLSSQWDWGHDSHDNSSWRQGGGWHANEDGPSTLELFKPLQPFLITWEVVQIAEASGGGGGKGKPKKATSVKAMPDWRNPLGFACNADDSLPAQELIG